MAARKEDDTAQQERPGPDSVPSHNPSPSQTHPEVAFVNPLSVLQVNQVDYPDWPSHLISLLSMLSSLKILM